MTKPSYLLVIMDSSGGVTRRVRVPKRAFKAAVGGALGALLLSFVMMVHGVTSYDDSRQAARLSVENLELSAALAELEGQVPQARVAAMRSEELFRRVWAHSGLGRSPSLLGVGPISGTAVQQEVQTSAPRSPEEALPPRQLLRAFGELEVQSRALQDGLELTLEYFDDAQRLLKNTPSIRPANDAWISSRFGRRHDPMHGGLVMHKGVDFAGYTGMPVVAPADGVVIWTGTRGGYGRTVVIDHGNGIQTHFAHLNRYDVRRGDHVARGEVVAEMGSTGKSTGPHLHYEVRRYGEPVDPLSFILN